MILVSEVGRPLAGGPMETATTVSIIQLLSV